MRKVLVAGAVLSSLALLAGTAHAVNHGHLLGTGTLSPGLPTSGCAFQSVSFSATAVIVGTNAGTYSVRFNGNSDICETYSTGHGSGTLSGGVSGSVTYSRTGIFATLSGSITWGSTTETFQLASCAWDFTSANPSNSYGVICEVVTA